MRKAMQGLVGAALVVLLSPALAAAEGKTKIHWYGQAAFRIETPSGGVILIDPWLSVPTNPDKNSIAALERVDYILLTHGHRDHVGDAVEIAKKTGAALVAPYGLQFNLKSVMGYPEAQATAVTAVVGATPSWVCVSEPTALERPSISCAMTRFCFCGSCSVGLM